MVNIVLSKIKFKTHGKTQYVQDNLFLNFDLLEGRTETGMTS